MFRTVGVAEVQGAGAAMNWARILAYVTAAVDQELLARNEYLAGENRILKAQLNGRLRLSDADRATLGEMGHRLGRKVLAEVATVAQPAANALVDPILRRHPQEIGFFPGKIMVTCYADQG